MYIVVPAASAAIKLDLKGVLYSADVLPLAGAVMVVNIGPTDAKAGGSMCT